MPPAVQWVSQLYNNVNGSEKLTVNYQPKLSVLPSLGPRPLDVFLKAMPYRLFMGVVFIFCVWWANVVRGPGQEFYPIYFYVTILLVYGVHQVMYSHYSFT